MNTPARTWLIRIVWVLTVGVVAALAWFKFRTVEDNPAVVGANGRIEATDIDIATKSPGRVKDILVRRGRLRHRRARCSRVWIRRCWRRSGARPRRNCASPTSRSTPRAPSRRSARPRRQAAVAVVAQRDAELDAAKKRFGASEQLAKSGAGSIGGLDNDARALRGRQGGGRARREAQVAATDSAISAARVADRQRRGARSTRRRRRSSASRPTSTTAP